MLKVSMSNKMYDALQIVCRMILPFVDFITALGSIWHIKYAAEICATLTAFHVLLGAFLKIASDTYKRQNYERPDPEVDESEAVG